MIIRIEQADKGKVKTRIFLLRRRRNQGRVERTPRETWKPGGV